MWNDDANDGCNRVGVSCGKLRSELETGKRLGSLAVRILRSIVTDRLLLALNNLACEKGSLAPKGR